LFAGRTDEKKVSNHEMVVVEDVTLVWVAIAYRHADGAVRGADVDFIVFPSFSLLCLVVALCVVCSPSEAAGIRGIIVLEQTD
jgi:hypothetical protein